MSADVEILAAADVPAEWLTEIDQEVRGWGLGTRVSRAPRRRGAIELSWMLLVTLPAEAVAKAALETAGDDLCRGLRALFHRVLRHRPARGAVIIESAETGAQYALEPDLPVDAYRRLVEDIAERPPHAGVRVYDRSNHCWQVDQDPLPRHDPLEDG